MKTWRGVLAAMAAVAAFAQQPTPEPITLKLGAPFPAVALLGEHRGKRQLLLVGPGEVIPESTKAELAKLETTLVVLRAESWLDPQFRTPGGLPQAYLIDKDGILRWIERGNASNLSERLVRLVRQRDRGKWSYDSQCARCHGADGNDTGYAPNIKKLGGIGNRLTPVQIMEATASTGVVSFSGWTQDDLDALALYVAGL
jgi:cytochrome c553